MSSRLLKSSLPGSTRDVNTRSQTGKLDIKRHSPSIDTFSRAYLPETEHNLKLLMP